MQLRQVHEGAQLLVLLFGQRIGNILQIIDGLPQCVRDSLRDACERLKEAGLVRELEPKFENVPERALLQRSLR